METSENNNATSSPSPTPDASLRRRSGRVVRAPRKFSPDVYSSQNGKSATKRKRGPDADDEDEENQAPDGEQAEKELTDEEVNDEGEEPEEEEEEEEDDEPTPRPKKSKSKSSRNPRPKKPATKRTKVNGDVPTINVDATAPNAPAVKLPNRPKKTARIAVANLRDDGLYGKI